MLKLKTVTKVANKENLKELVLTSIASCKLTKMNFFYSTQFYRV